VWGSHAAAAALANPARKILQTLATRNAAKDLPDGVDVEVVEPRAIDTVLPRGAVHQGIAVRTEPLEPVALGELLQPASGIIVLLDQVTDPQNVGAMLRSATAFGARGIILQDRKAPPFSGGCAKAAVGAAERIPHARVVNLSRALQQARDAGWFSIALAGEATMDIEAALALSSGAIILALGAEDKGLRPSIRDACDVVAHIPISDAVESLNVSNAAALALYEARRRLSAHP